MARDLFQEAGISVGNSGEGRDLFQEAGIRYEQPRQPDKSFLENVKDFGTRFIDEDVAGMDAAAKRKRQQQYDRANALGAAQVAAQTTGLNDAERAQQVAAAAAQENRRDSVGGRVADTVAGAVDLTRDLGLGFVKGGADTMVKLPLAVSGIAEDLTGTRKGLEGLGYRSKDALGVVDDFGKWLDSLKSESGQARDRDFNATRGVVATLGEMGANPAMIMDKVSESLVGIGAIGKTAGAAVEQAMPWLAKQAAAKGLVGQAADDFIIAAATKIAQVAAPVSEGVQSGLDIAGTAQEAGRTIDQYGKAALAAGAFTAAVGFGSNKLGAKAGIGDIETDIALRGTGSTAAKTGHGGLSERFIKEGLKEGIVEELPQSVGESAAENAAMGRPWDQGLGKSAVTGALTGFGMGGGHAALSREGAQPEGIPVSPNLGEDTQSGGIAPLYTGGKDQTQAPVKIEKAATNNVAPTSQFTNAQAARMAELELTSEQRDLTPQEREEAAALSSAMYQEEKQPTPPVNTAQAAANTIADTGDHSVGTSDTTEAEKALREPVKLTALDRANEIDTELSWIQQRQQELAPENGYGPAFDTERAELAATAQPLQQERDSIAQTWPKAVTGAPASFSTEAGVRLDGQYALMDAGDLVTSHDEYLRANPVYPKELQPRDRSRAASELQVNGIAQKLDPARLGMSADAATGAPIVGADGLVESGNARTIALKQVYKNGGLKAEDYKQFLRTNAAQFGITPESVDGMAKPVLVRVRSTPVNRAEFARQANASTVQRMSPSEQALSDSKRLSSLEGLKPDDNGDFDKNYDFIRQFMGMLPVTEQSDMIESDGKLSTFGYRRMQNAVLAKAYGDSPTLRRMTESMDDNLRNITKALTRVAPVIANARERMDAGTMHKADVAPDLIQAVEGLSALKDKGWSVSDELGQGDLTGPKYSPESAQLLTFLNDNMRSPRKIAEFMQRYYEALESAGDPSQGSMFGDEGPAPTRAGLIKTAQQGAQNGNTAQDAQRGVNREGAQADAPGGGQPQDAPGGGRGDQGNGLAGSTAGGETRLSRASEVDKSEWVAFPKKTGTIGIPRADMPQVKGEHRGALIQFLQGRGISHETKEVPARSLKPTQAEFSTKKAARWSEVRDGVDRSVLVSSDGHILDGHHQWVPALAANESVKAIVLDAPIRELMAAVFQFPSVKRSDGATQGGDGRSKARQDFKNALADLALIATKHTRAMMLPENTPNLMPTLVKLFTAGIAEVGYSIKDLTAYVKNALKNTPEFKTFWNKIGTDTYNKAARQAMEGMQLSATAHVDDLFSAAEKRGQRVNYKPPALDTFLPAELLTTADGYIKKFQQESEEVPVPAEDMARATKLLKPVIAKAKEVLDGYSQKIVDLAETVNALGYQIGSVKKIERAAAKLADKETNFDLGKMRDILRSTIVVRSYDDLQAVVDEIYKSFTVETDRVKNRTPAKIEAKDLHPDTGFLESGYGDVLINVIVDGVKAEIQINIPEMLAVKAGQGHALYNIERVQPEGSEIRAAIAAAGKELYKAAYASAVSASRSLAALTTDSGLLAASKKELSESLDQRSGHQSVGVNSSDGLRSSTKNRFPSGNSTYDRSTPSSSVKSIPNLQPSGNLSGINIAIPPARILPDGTKNSDSGAAPAKLSRGNGEPAGMDVGALDTLVAGIIAKNPNMPKVHVLADPSKAPKALREYIIRQDAWNDVEGAMHDGELYMFASGLSDPLRAEHVLAEHEAAHFGLRALLGDSLKTAMNLVYANNGVVRKAATDLQKRGKLTNTEAVEEIIVDIPSADLAKLEGWRRVTVMARDWLAGHGFDGMAQKLTDWLDGSLTDQQRADLFVADLVRSARDYVAGKRPGRYSATGTRLSATLAEDIAKQEKWLQAEAQARGFKDIEDLLEKNYPVFENLAALWRTKNPEDTLLSRGTAAPPSLQAPQNPWQKLKSKVNELTSPDRIASLIYEYQDKFIDLKNLREHIKALGGTITDLNDAYLGEELYHKRVAKRTHDFLADELKPLLADMRSRGVTLPQFEEYLHARHAPEANSTLAARNPTQAMIDMGKDIADADIKALEMQLQAATAKGSATKAIEKALQTAREARAEWSGAQAFQGTEEERTSLSGMSDAQAQAVMDALPPGGRVHMDALAARVDAINTKTMDTLAKYGLMDRESLNAWSAAYKFYIPLHRDEAHPDSVSHPIGQGFSTKGDAVKRRIGSNEKVTNILAHVAMQRETALTRGEKNMVVKKLYLMAAQNPDPEWWTVDKPPMLKTVDKKTGFVRSSVDPMFKNKPNVVMLRVAGKDVAITFNEHNPQAARLALAIKNQDIGDMSPLTTGVGKGTRWLASVNTQYNPVFGLFNFARDVQAAILQLSTTPLRGQEKAVAANMPGALKGVYNEVRSRRKGGAPGQGEWAKLWEEMQDTGGTTGYRDLYADPKERVKELESALAALDRGEASKAAHAVVDWLSDYNESMENSTRLAAYKVALDQGMSKERAASLAKNLTVNFNRKGRQTSTIGAYYAFLNAAIQGTTRMVETLRGPAGKKIMLGGVMLGMVNTLLGMAMMGGGGDDDEEDNWAKIPSFVKERSLIIPLGKEDYLAIPLPLGFNMLPNIGRKAIEMMAHKDPSVGAGAHVAELLGMLINAFNPFGGAPDMSLASGAMVVSPTVVDIPVSLALNRDWTGKPIYREDSNKLDPTPGHKRTKDSATPWGKGVSEALNWISGGSDYRPGGISWTPDQIDYVIGQLTGGLGREIGKVAQTLQAPFTADELPSYKVPLLGRLYGNTRGPSSNSEAYYKNVRELNEIESEVKGRSRDDKDADAYMKEEPLAGMVGLGNAAEHQIKQLRHLRSQIVKNAEPGYRAEAKEIDERMGEVMRGLNNDVKRARREAVK